MLPQEVNTNLRSRANTNESLTVNITKDVQSKTNELRNQEGSIVQYSHIIWGTDESIYGE
jgi:hypothetical protein